MKAVSRERHTSRARATDCHGSSTLSLTVACIASSHLRLPKLRCPRPGLLAGPLSPARRARGCDAGRRAEEDDGREDEITSGTMRGPTLLAKSTIASPGNGATSAMGVGWIGCGRILAPHWYCTATTLRLEYSTGTALVLQWSCTGRPEVRLQHLYHTDTLRVVPQCSPNATPVQSEPTEGLGIDLWNHINLGSNQWLMSCSTHPAPRTNASSPDLWSL